MNKLSNIDKHRACNVTLAYNRNAHFVIHCNDGSRLSYSPSELLYLGDVQTFALPINKAIVQPSARIQSSGTLILTFREESDWDDVPVTQVLRECFDHIEQKVIGPLKPFFDMSPK